MDDQISILATTVDRWHALGQRLSNDLLSRQPAPGEWSARQVLAHLLDTEQFVFPVRVRAFLAGQDFPAFDPASHGAKPDPHESLLQMVERFAALRQESLALLDSLTTGDLERSARHAELGQVTLGQMLNEWAGHDLDHTIQAERAILQPFIEACGPWQVYFEANRIQSETE